MAKIKRLIRNMPLPRAFIFCVTVAMTGAVLLSGVTIWGCMAVRKWLLPKTEDAVLSLNAEYADGTREEHMTVILSEGAELPLLLSDDGAEGNPIVSYTFDKVEKSYKTLSPKRQLLYMAASGTIIALPMLYSLAGILLCAVWFYKQKLKEPLQSLEMATEHIARQDLDFAVAYESGDELGQLCVSFEKMRAALAQTQREMWEMLEERRKLQASIAHDLRNPIAIIKGYAEYLQIHLPKGNMKPGQVLMIADNLAASAARLERYTDSVRDINQLEALEIRRVPCQVPRFLNETAEDMRILAERSHIVLTVSNPVPEAGILLDTQSYSRVLENILQNALRYARQEVRLSWALENGTLITTVADDGPGFSEDALKREKHIIFPADGKHMGMGLAVSGILCGKHGGTLELRNDPAGGAVTQFSFRVR